VQDAVQAALGQIAGHAVAVKAAGRTDRGVHARGQVAHFETGAERPPTAWVRGVNAFLPESVAVQWAVTVPPEFHARYSALARTYRYRLANRPVRPALEARYAGWYYARLDLESMRKAAGALIGEHDFSAFRAAECQASTPVRTMHSIDIAERGGDIEFVLRANAFLQHMVRNIVGTLLAIGQGEAGAGRAREQLESRRRSTGEATAAAHGLYLWQVDYPREFGLPDDSAMIGPFEAD
jgi:tRNA pseudouridine38-40 synthase